MVLRSKKEYDFVNISDTAIIYDGAEIGDGAIIHDYVVIYPNAFIRSNVEVFEFCVVGKPPRAPMGTTARAYEQDIKTTEIGIETVLSPGCVVYADVIIGKNTLLGDHCSIREQCCIGESCIISRNVSINYNSSIGSYTKIMDNTHITGNCIVGDHCFISTLVATTNDNTMGREDYSEDHIGGPIIGDYTTVGAGANILPNVTIGKNCIIGAGALVTKDVPDNKVVMGLPGRIIRDVR